MVLFFRFNFTGETLEIFCFVYHILASSRDFGADLRISFFFSLVQLIVIIGLRLAHTLPLF